MTPWPHEGRVRSPAVPGYPPMLDEFVVRAEFAGASEWQPAPCHVPISPILTS